MSSEGRTCPVEIKFQQLYFSQDLSGLTSDMSSKCLWNPVKGPDLLWDRSNRSDWCALPV
jgi:hypothetical protein